MKPARTCMGNVTVNIMAGYCLYRYLMTLNIAKLWLPNVLFVCLFLLKYLNNRGMDGWVQVCLSYPTGSEGLCVPPSCRLEGWDCLLLYTTYSSVNTWLLYLEHDQNDKYLDSCLLRSLSSMSYWDALDAECVMKLTLGSGGHNCSQFCFFF